MRKYFLAAFMVLGICFFPVIKGHIPLPLDVLVGGYYPWLDYKWGYSVGVPYKNTSVSDVFSQTYPWRILGIDMIKKGIPPLWNPYSFSGTPLLANWQSSPLYPLNLVIFVFGSVWGWTLFVALQPFLASLFTYLYLRQLRLSPLAAFLGGLIFSLAGFMTTYLEYGTTGHILLWLPLLLLAIDRALFLSLRNLVYIPVILFFVLTAGFFQPAFYVLLISAAYGLFRARLMAAPGSTWLKLALAFLLGLSLSAAQLLPTGELLAQSIRSADHNLNEYNFGLLPPQNLITFLAPDFFGSPSTHNFRGVIGYQETSPYFSGIVVVFVISSFFTSRPSKLLRFFQFFFLLSLILAFNNPISRAVFSLHLFGFSAGYASRWLMLTGFCAAILAANSFDSWRRNRNFLPWAMITLAVFLALVTGIAASFHYLSSAGFTSPELTTYLASLRISLRNSLLPLLLLAVLTFISIFVRRFQILVVAVVLAVGVDLVRYNVKFTPFSPVRFTHLDLPVTDFLKANLGDYRLEGERNITLPANSWLYYSFPSPSGYDPLYLADYARFYKLYSAGNYVASPAYSRYAQLENYASPFLDLAGVKYILAVKRDAVGVVTPDGQSLDYRLKHPRFTPVFSDAASVVLENTEVIPRVSLYSQVLVQPDQASALRELADLDFKHTLILDSNPPQPLSTQSPGDYARIEKYLPHRVEIAAAVSGPQMLLLTDVRAPGWQARLDGQPAHIFTAFGIYRAVYLPSGSHNLSFSYSPLSFTIGCVLSLASALLLYGYFYTHLRRQTSS